MQIQSENLKDLEQCNLKDANIYKYFSSESHDVIQLGQIQSLIRKMINVGVKTSEEPFFKGIV